jgi:hypothetical protein
VKTLELIYLASPYTHKDEAVMESRYLRAMECRAAMMRDGLHVYSPIVDCHAMSRRCTMPSTWEYWQAFDELLISRCDRLWVLTIDGWDKSVGVTAEVQIAERLKKPLDFIEWDGERYAVLASHAIPARNVAARSAPVPT